MSIRTVIDDWAVAVRRRATRGKFREDLYGCEWSGTTSEYYEDHWYYAEREPLTLERYLNGQKDDSDWNQYYYAKQGSEVWDHVYGQYSWVEERIKSFGHADLPALRDSLMVPSFEAAMKLCRDLDTWLPKRDGESGYVERDMDADIGGAKLTFENGLAELDRWNGAAASAFKNAFGVNAQYWVDVVQHLYFLVEALEGAVEAQIATIVSARDAVINIADNTDQALCNLYDDAGGLTKDEILAIKIGVSVIGFSLAAMSFGTTSAFVGAAFAITMDCISASQDGKTGNGKTTKGDQPIGGDTVDDILYSMSSALYTVRDDMSDYEGEIADKLTDIYGRVVGGRDDDNEPYWNRYEITFPDDAPDLADATAENIESSEMLGERHVEANLGDLVDAATVAFPDAVEVVYEANQLLAGTSGNESAAFQSDYNSSDGGDGSWVTTVKDPWMDLRDLAQDLIAANGARIEAAGDALLIYATAIGELDEAEADRIRGASDGFDTSGNEHELPDETSRPGGGENYVE